MKAGILIGGLPLLALVIMLMSGCGTSTGSSYGADGGTWPTGPTRATTAETSKPTEQTPNTTLMVLLRGATAEGIALDLHLTGVDVKYKDRWVAVAKKDDLAKLDKMPIRVTDKGAFALLVNTTAFPKRKYSHLRLNFEEKKTVLYRGDKKMPLVVQAATLELGDWTPDEQATNLLTITVDGTRATLAESNATLPAAALTITPGTPAAGISGKVLSPNPTGARVYAYWGAGKVALGDATPDARTGEFQITRLPAGRYRLEIAAQGFKVVEPRKDPLLLEDKIVPLGEIQLTKDVP